MKQIFVEDVIREIKEIIFQYESGLLFHEDAFNSILIKVVKAPDESFAEARKELLSKLQIFSQQK